MYLTSTYGPTKSIRSYATYLKLKKKITLEIKIVLEAYITMDFDVICCNYEIFSFCQTAIGEKLSEKFEGTATIYKLQQKTMIHNSSTEQ